MAKTRKEAFLELIEKQRTLEKLSNTFEKTKAEHVDIFSSIKTGDELVHRSGRLMKIYLVKITDVFKDGVKITAYGYLQNNNGLYGKHVGAVHRIVILKEK